MQNGSVKADAAEVVVGRSADQATPILLFCDGQRLSRAARIVLLVRVCSLVASHHESGWGFRSLDARAIRVRSGRWCWEVELEPPLPLPPLPRDGATGSGPIAREVTLGANLYQLGQLVARVLGDDPDREVSRLVQLATSTTLDARRITARKLGDALCVIRLRCDAESEE
jgi:hypothetical protein